MISGCTYEVDDSDKTVSTTEQPAEEVSTPVAETTADQNVKEVVMESFTEIVDGKYFPQYSVKEVTVKKGDLVRFKITAKSGMHNFKIDEFDAFAETPLNEETVVEFTADKVGEFVYYCTKPGHRQNGHWGTLKVVE